MSLFIILFILIALFAVMDYYSQHNIGLFLSAIVLAVVAGIRYNVGYDYQSYYWYYQSGQNGERFQWGFILLNKIAHFLHFSFFDFQFLFSCLTIGLLAYFLYKNIPAGISGLGMLYYFSRFYWIRDLGQIRSSLASVICLYSIKYIRERKFLPFLLVILLAGSIHKGAYIFILAYFVANFLNKNFTIKQTIAYLVIFLAGGELLTRFPALVQKIMNNSTYTTVMVYTSGSSGSIATVIIQVVVILMFAFVRKNICDKKEQHFVDSIANVYLTGTLIALIFIGYRTLGYRLDTLLNTTELILVPYLVSKLSNNKTVVVMINIIASAAVLYMIMFYGGSYLNFVPFTTVFSPIK